MRSNLDQQGVITDKSLIHEYFHKCFTYGSLFISSDVSLRVKIVSELKNVNEGFEELSLVPLDDEDFSFLPDEEVVVVNESNNISFRSTVLKNHASKWITIKMPTSLKLVNLRHSKRYIPSKNLSPTNWIISYGEFGDTKKSQFEATVLDISSTGTSMKVKSRRMDGLFRGDVVEVNISENISSLSRVRGLVVHKTMANISKPEDRFVKVGIKFDSRQEVTGLVD